jgi:hypothetical protein
MTIERHVRHAMLDTNHEKSSAFPANFSIFMT